MRRRRSHHCAYTCQGIQVETRGRTWKSDSIAVTPIRLGVTFGAVTFSISVPSGTIWDHGTWPFRHFWDLAGEADMFDDEIVFSKPFDLSAWTSVIWCKI